MKKIALGVVLVAILVLSSLSHAGWKSFLGGSAVGAGVAGLIHHGHKKDRQIEYNRSTQELQEENAYLKAQLDQQERERQEQSQARVEQLEREVKKLREDQK